MARARATGSALAVETVIAEQYGLSRGTLRNYADAVALVRTLPDPTLRSVLLRSSAVAAGTVARWFQRDSLGVLGYLEQVGCPPNPLDDRALLSADRASRKAVPPSGHRREGVHALDKQLADLVALSPLQLRQEFTEAIGWFQSGAEFSASSPHTKLDKFLGIAHVVSIRRADSMAPSERHVGFIEITGRVTLERYRAEARATWSRAVAASLYFDALVIVLPNSAARRQLLASIPMEAAEWSGHPLEERAAPTTGRKSCRSRLVVAKIAQTSPIIVATLRSVLHDLVEIRHVPRTV